MPELPEVETVKNGLIHLLGEGAQIERVKLLRQDLRFSIPPRLANKLKGQRILEVRRRAKYLLFVLEKGVFVSHLGMTGTWRLAPKGEEKLHDHIYIYLKDKRRLAYRDPRRFGYVDYFKLGEEDQYKGFKDLGPEPLSKDFNRDYLLGKLKGRSAPIKNIIMNQKVVVGVGNIYACEALFKSGVHPERPGGKVDKPEAALLVKEVKKVLRAAIKSGGSTISDFKQAGGDSGYFQTQFLVYDKKGKPCKICNSKIQKIIVGGRGTFFCEKCQR